MIKFHQIPKRFWISDSTLVPQPRRKWWPAERKPHPAMALSGWSSPQLWAPQRKSRCRPCRSQRPRRRKPHRRRGRNTKQWRPRRKCQQQGSSSSQHLQPWQKLCLTLRYKQHNWFSYPSEIFLHDFSDPSSNGGSHLTWGQICVLSRGAGFAVVTAAGTVLVGLGSLTSWQKKLFNEVGVCSHPANWIAGHLVHRVKHPSTCNSAFPKILVKRAASEIGVLITFCWIMTIALHAGRHGLKCGPHPHPSKFNCILYPLISEQLVGAAKWPWVNKISKHLFGKRKMNKSCGP